MAVQITIIGLGQIGASVGLALEKHTDKVIRVGHDKKIEAEREAQKKGAVDKTIHNLPNAVKDAKLIVLCIPTSQIRATFDFISEDLQEGAVILDTAPIKTEVAKWAKEFLPQDCYYVGLVPALNPEYLHNMQFGIEAARADLFQRGVFAMDAPTGTPEEALLLASDFVRLLGATPLLAGMDESDGLMARAHLLPQLVAAALLNATIDQPGWLEARKLAGRPYATVTSGLAYHDEIDSLRMSALQNRANVVHSLDVMMSALKGLRDDIEKGADDFVAARLEAALEGRQKWLGERTSAAWEEKREAAYPSMGERLFGNLFAKRPRPKE